MRKPVTSLLQKIGQKTQKFTALGNELLAHLHYDAGVNGSKFAESPVGRIILKSGTDSLYRKLLELTTSNCELTPDERQIAEQFYESKPGIDEFQAYGIWLEDVGCLAAYESIYPDLFQTPNEAEACYERHKHEGVPHQIVKVNVVINVLNAI